MDTFKAKVFSVEERQETLAKVCTSGFKEGGSQCHVGKECQHEQKLQKDPYWG